MSRAPAPGDIKIVNTAQDRFYNTDLDKALKAKGMTTIIMVGKSNVDAPGQFRPGA